MNMTHLFIRALGLLILWQAGPVIAAKNVQVSEVASGVYVYQGVHEQMSPANLGAIGNSGFIVGKRSVAVIDPGGSPEFGRQLRAVVQSVTDLPVDYLILTHFHPDHAAGAMAFPEAEHVIAHEKYVQAMTQRAQFYLERFAGFLDGRVQDVFRSPTTTVKAGQSLQISLGGRRLSIEAYKVAHTDNDVTVYDEQTRTLWASDLLFSGRTPSLDGSLAGWLDVLSLLDERDYAMTIPGHGAPAPWDELVKPNKNYLMQLRDTVRDLLDKGFSLSEVLAIHDASHISSAIWALYAAQHGNNLAKAYAELEWE